MILSYVLINISIPEYDVKVTREDCSFINAIKENKLWKEKHYIIAIPNKCDAFIKRYNAVNYISSKCNILTVYESNIIAILDRLIYLEQFDNLLHAPQVNLFENYQF